MASTGTYIVMLPPDYAANEKRYPVCILLHGRGSNEMKQGVFADLLGRDGVIYVAIRAPQARLDAKHMELGWGVFPDNVPDADATTGAAVIQNFIDWIFSALSDAKSKYRIDPGRVFIYGHSMGGSFAIGAALSRPDQLRGVFAESGGGLHKSDGTAENLERMRQAGVSVHLLQGIDDPIVPPEATKEAKAAFDAAGVKSTFDLIPGGHSPTDEAVALIRRWVDDEVRLKQ